MRWNSVRVRLTLWNAAMAVLLLAGSGLALCYRVQADLRHSVDQDLAQDAERLAAHPPGRHAPASRVPGPLEKEAHRGVIGDALGRGQRPRVGKGEGR